PAVLIVTAPSAVSGAVTEADMVVPIRCIDLPTPFRPFWTLLRPSQNCALSIPRLTLRAPITADAMVLALQIAGDHRPAECRVERLGHHLLLLPGLTPLRLRPVEHARERRHLLRARQRGHVPGVPRPRIVLAFQP